MKVSMCKTMRTYEWKNLSKDLLAGLVIMAVSIPISMGYAQIAGLPAVYGLYGSVFPLHRSLSSGWMRLRRHWWDRHW